MGMDIGLYAVKFVAPMLHTGELRKKLRQRGTICPESMLRGAERMKFTKKEMMNAFILFLDDALPTFTCEKIDREGNSRCHRCDLCMMRQYLERVRNGETPRIARENGGSAYPLIE